MRLAGKTTLLTGAANGIGRALALEIIQSGGQVIGCDIREDGLAHTRELLSADMRANFEIQNLDVTDREAILELSRKLEGQVDCLINCAGMIQPFVRLSELEDAALEKVFAVNWFGTLNMVRAFLPQLAAKTEAQLVNFGSMSSIAPLPGQAIYGASKAAIKQLTESLYAEHLDARLQVTLILPGAVATNISGNSGVEMPTRSGDESRPSDVAGVEEAARTIMAGIEAGDYRVLVDKMMIDIDGLYRRDPKEAVETVARNFGGLLSS